MKKRLFSVGTKLLLLLFLVGLVPSGVAIYLLYNGAVATTQETLAYELAERANGVATVLDEALATLFGQIQQVADKLSHGESLEKVALPNASGFAGQVVADSKGIVLEAIGEGIDGGVDIPRVFDQAKNKPKLYVDEMTTGPFAPAVRFVAALPEEHYFLAVVRLEKFLELFSVSLPGDQTQLALVTNRHNTLGRTPPPNEVVRAVLERSTRSRSQLAGWTFVQLEAPGPQYLAAYRASTFFRQRQKPDETSVDWFVVAYADTQFVIPALNALLWRIGILGIGLACLLAVLSAIVSTSFLRPLRTLHRQVERVTAGEWDVGVDIRTGDEIEELANAFVSMLAEIRRSREALERQIAQTHARATQVALVNELSRSILGTFSIQRFLETTFARLSNLVGAKNLCLVLRRGTKWEFKSLNEFPLEVSDDDSFWDDVWQDLCEAPQGIAELKGQSHVFTVRLASGEERLGILVIPCAPQSQWGVQEITLLSQLAPFLSLAVQHIQLYEQVCNFAAELEHKVEERAAQLEEAHRRLMQSERLAVTGQLAAGVAHEINNPLAIIKNMLQVMRLENASNSSTLKIIEEEIDRIARIVRSLLNYARPPATSGPPANIEEEVRHVLALLATPLRHHQIQVHVEIVPDLPQVSLSRDSFHQVLLNLLRNAQDAVKEGGQITIRAKTEVVSGRPHVIVTVEDNGEGIPEEILPHIFEPFVTTKRGEGAGLGLSVSYGLVTAVGGRIEVESEHGKGTIFRLVLPIADEATPSS